VPDSVDGRGGGRPRLHLRLLEKLTELDADALLDAVDEAERANLIVAAVEGPPSRERASS
jgi:hypothetical protein